jgi:hypothetical protein
MLTVSASSPWGRRTAPPHESVLIYDGDCGFCQRTLDAMKKRLATWPRTAQYQRLNLDQHGVSSQGAARAMLLIAAATAIRDAHPGENVAISYDPGPDGDHDGGVPQGTVECPREKKNPNRSGRGAPVPCRSPSTLRVQLSIAEM